MTKQVRLIRTMTYEYTPDPENYPEDYTLEQMARLDAEHEDPNILFAYAHTDEVTYEIINGKTNEFTKSFLEALDDLASGKQQFAQGELFKEGVYITFDRSSEILQLVDASGTFRNTHTATINKDMFTQKYKTFNVANKKEIGLEG
ncbi:hypothetical protein MOB49_12200 [Bacillus haynesii]|uniref:hypothetical protein n=1 Tax=Bacillus TaxID=1386 RepID=UPI00227F7342|nr:MULTISPECIES: hypothetical protein [Bacillus]MCY7967852.1 hypothetical protein [Bacillus haynesii]MCY8102350.1 hypothetical protein [Bacillus haynesii]MCY8152004.1 hypothetical protein [Bacillus paralicheniformis]MCY8665232.1 hypothetical protein [Bacillus haynesii]MEC1050912.1 hypothetical protein [Bacillus paralicheniformis]